MSDVDVLRNGIAEFFEVGVLLFVTDAATFAEPIWFVWL